MKSKSKHNIQNDKNCLRSQSLDLLRFPLAVVILIIHVFSPQYTTPIRCFFDIANYPIFTKINDFISGFLSGQSVPIYFFISGFVFFLGVKLTKEKYIQKLKNRVKTLLIPYLIWNTIAIIFMAFRLLPYFNSFPGNSDFSFDPTLSSILSSYWIYNGDLFPASAGAEAAAREIGSLYPINAPLWFIRDLMVVVLCAPILYWILKHTRYYFVSLLGILWFALSHYNVSRIDQLLTAFFFFGWGAYMSINKKDMLIEFGKFFNLSLLLYPCLALLSVMTIHSYPEVFEITKKLNIFVGVFFAYNIATWLLKRSFCKVSPFLASSSFFIYLSHGLICGRLLKILLLEIKPSSDISILMVYILTTTLSLSIMLLSFYLLRRYTPGLLKVLAGRK